MQTIILARHGNTFESSQQAYFVGCNEDLPLTAKGQQQARDLAAALSRCDMVPDRILCGPLERTRTYAEIIRKQLGLTFSTEVNSALNELDYGDWSGLNDQQIISSFGVETLENWTKRGQPPKNCNWQPSEIEIENQNKTLYQELLSDKANQCALLVSSNGRLKYFLKLLALDYSSIAQAGELSIKTGHVAIIKIESGQNARLLTWNVSPSAL